MFGLGKHGPDALYGAIIDIGSASVGVAIVVSDPTQEQPTIIWTHRETAAGVLSSEGISIKDITATLISAVLVLGGDGVRAMREHDSKSTLDHMQVAIAAPWSYTVSRSVHFDKEKPFSISKRLVSELIHTAEKEAKSIIDESGILNELQLIKLASETLQINANGYPLKSINDQTASGLSLAQVNVFTQQKLLEAITEAKDKVVPGAKLATNSFMLHFFKTLRSLQSDISEACFVDITNEATEIGIVREGVLQYVTHTSSGSISIAREIGVQCKVTTEDALSFLRGNNMVLEGMSVAKKQALEEVIDRYVADIEQLFQRTGDQLSIPRSVFVHVEDRAGRFFCHAIKDASEKATKSEHSMHLVTARLMPEQTIQDTAILLSAQQFHNQHQVANADSN